MPSTADSPVLVEVLRGTTVESRHRGAFVVIDARGGVVAASGEIDAPVYPRSAIKPLQALPLVESGAADAFRLTPRELALSCASHRGEAAHVSAVRAWLDGIGLGPDALECGAHVPNDGAAADALVRAGTAPSQMHNNCSGKHSGFLCTAVHQGEDPRGYIGPDHPVQRRVAAAIAEMTDTDLSAAPCGCDGCGIPTYGVPLRGLALGMARMMTGHGLGPTRAAASRRLLDAMGQEPFYVSGSGTFVTDCMRASAATVRVKTGAEGVYAAALPQRGLGVALKIEDGAKRASDMAIAALLEALGCFDDAARGALAPHLAPVLRNVAGREVGTIRATEVLRRAM